jgi:hypothetical protein
MSEIPPSAVITKSPDGMAGYAGLPSDYLGTASGRVYPPSKQIPGHTQRKPFWSARSKIKIKLQTIAAIGLHH